MGVFWPPRDERAQLAPAGLFCEANVGILRSSRQLVVLDLELYQFDRCMRVTHACVSVSLWVVVS